LGRGLHLDDRTRYFREETLGVWLQVGDERFDSDDIQRLCENDDYPLQRQNRM
jgi:hypothetical protein